MSVWCGTLQIIKFDTIIYACMVWHITVYSLKKIIKNWGTIICACMVPHSNAQRLLIICCTVVWHSPVLNVLIHLFELTSVLVQHNTEHEGEENFNMHLVHGTDNEAEMDVEFITDGSYNNWEKTTNTGGNIYSHFCFDRR